MPCFIENLKSISVLKDGNIIQICTVKLKFVAPKIPSHISFFIRYDFWSYTKYPLSCSIQSLSNNNIVVTIRDVVTAMEQNIPPIHIRQFKLQTLSASSVNFRTWLLTLVIGNEMLKIKFKNHGTKNIFYKKG